MLPNKHLRQSSKKVGLITPAVKKLVEDMKAATLDWEASRKHEVGVALASIQIDRPLKVMIIRDDLEDKKNESFSVFINPQITKYEGTLEKDFEGCLSVKDVYGEVPRHTKIRIKAIDLGGKEIRLKAEGFLARVFQHEIDHMNGTLFIDHIKKNPKAFYKIREDGKLEPQDYEKDIRDNRILW